MKYLYAIIRLFKCKHHWKILSGEPLYKKIFFKNTTNDKPHAFKYFLKCRKCGKIKEDIVKNTK